MWRVWWERRSLQFDTVMQSARGAYRYRDTWYVYLEADGVLGRGECGMLRGYSVDDVPDYEAQLDEACRWMTVHAKLPEGEWLRTYPSIRMGLEMAWLHWRAGGGAILFSSPFTDAQRPLTVQGLVSAGDEPTFWHQIQRAVRKGYSCVKVKIGLRPWEEEYAQLRALRSSYSSERLKVRLDVNGGWDVDTALNRLRALEPLEIDCVEQPLMPGRLADLAWLIQHTGVPIALDEELSHWAVHNTPEQLFERLHPHAIVIKPTGLGGFYQADRWREEADRHGIAWWVASTWESGWATFAIAQWAGMVDRGQCHGLGALNLFVDDYSAPLVMRGGKLYCAHGSAQTLKREGQA